MRRVKRVLAIVILAASLTALLAPSLALAGPNGPKVELMRAGYFSSGVPAIPSSLAYLLPASEKLIGFWPW